MQNICISGSAVDTLNETIEGRAPDSCPDCKFVHTNKDLGNGRSRQIWELRNDATGEVYQRGGVYKEPSDSVNGNRLGISTIGDSLLKFNAVYELSKGQIPTEPKDMTSDAEEGSGETPVKPEEPEPTDEGEEPKDEESDGGKEETSSGNESTDEETDNSEEPKEEKPKEDKPDIDTGNLAGDDADAWECSPLTKCIPPDDGSKIPDWIDPRTLPCATAKCPPINEVSEKIVITTIPLTVDGKVNCKHPTVTCSPREETIDGTSVFKDKHNNVCYQPLRAPVKEEADCEKGKPCKPSSSSPTCKEGMIGNMCKEIFCLKNVKDSRCKKFSCNFEPNVQGLPQKNMGCVEQTFDCKANPDALECSLKECSSKSAVECETSKRMFCLVNKLDKRCTEFLKPTAGAAGTNCALDPYAQGCSGGAVVSPELEKLCRGNPSLPICTK